ncbi:MAG: hypothetical protein ACON5M_03295 [Chitinophagales bacterium]
MKSYKSFVVTVMFLLNVIIAYSQGAYDWREHNEAMENMERDSVFRGLLILLFIIGIIKLLSNRPPKKANKNIANEHVRIPKKANKNVANEHVRIPKKDEYIGEKKGRKKHGIGKMTYANGDYYEGEWRNNKKHGYGIYTTQGLTYEGEFVFDRIHGKGTVTYPDGTKRQIGNTDGLL